MAYKPGIDKILLSVTFALTVIGLVMVMSASFVQTVDKEDSYYVLLRQFTFAVCGFIALFVLMHVDYRFFQKFKVMGSIVVLSAAALLVVMTQDAVNGARRWISVRDVFSIQPSEFAKLAVLIFMAWFLQKYGKTFNQPKHIAAAGAVVTIFMILIVCEPDLGQAFIICFIAAILLVLAGLSWRCIAGAILAAVPLFYFFVYNVDYRWKRIEAFLHPENSPDASWQINQSLIAIGSGGFWGLGPGNSKQKLFFLPESSTDFIFAVICEEWGLIGAVTVVAAFLIFFYRGLKIASKSQDKFGFYLGAGITLMVTLQGLINIAMVLGMLPTKGVALPFISQGGSSLLMNLSATGILLNLSHQNKLVETVE